MCLGLSLQPGHPKPTAVESNIGPFTNGLIDLHEREAVSSIRVGNPPSVRDKSTSGLYNLSL